VGNITDNQTF